LTFYRYKKPANVGNNQQQSNQQQSLSSMQGVDEALLTTNGASTADPSTTCVAENLQGGYLRYDQCKFSAVSRNQACTSLDDCRSVCCISSIGNDNCGIEQKPDGSWIVQYYSLNRGNVLTKLSDNSVKAAYTLTWQACPQ
jgi:hypothetical protein